MSILLPKNKDTGDHIEVDSNKIVVVGANGSGKTRFGSKTEELRLDDTLRISAQKSLAMPKSVSPKSRLVAEREFWYGQNNDDENWLRKHGKRTGRWQQNFSTSLLNDFDKLMVLLHTEEYEDSLAYKEGLIDKPTTKLDKLQILWEKILEHRKLIKKAGVIEVSSIDGNGDTYNASNMSDGERVIFYMIGEIICAKEGATIIIDEPELHLHKSIAYRLWDGVEEMRQDCTFIYLTHDIDFATTRTDATKIWIKSFDGNDVWDYKILDQELDLPEEVYLEVLGSRKPVLFIEGDSGSYDSNLYRVIFNDHTCKPVGSHYSVFQSVTAFNNHIDFHHIESFGIVDRDARTDEEIKNINNKRIKVLDVSEVENLFLLEEIVKSVATKVGIAKSSEVFENVSSNVFEFFSKELENQALLHTKSRIDRIFKEVSSSSSKSIDELDEALNSFWEEQNFKSIYESIKEEFQNLLDTKNYDGVLKVFNNKGLLPNSKVASECGLNPKGGNYTSYVINILKSEDDVSESIKSAIHSKLIVTE